ncbi:hypothetical protein RRG08_042093 [Elysia crispata]|uniref:E3 ubiquitin-protein ligase n=1 Tax=Elysia crispata TaxID=231223 RepID=A0AAE1CXL1_9GAST|nr:hypothetical protein RRG08_042093 [Elysia crispata]
MQHKLWIKTINVKPKEQGAYVAESTTEVAPYSMYKKINVGPPGYKTTHSDSFKDPRRPERREYGSPVDSAQPQSKGFFTERKKIRIQVMKSDITTQQVDAIVNAANGSLKHGGGVARAIADKAGSELQMECARFIKDGNAIPVTGLFVSCGGKLPAKHVIHAVGPRWSRYGEEKKEECARDLRRTVLRCLVEADQRGLRSIAIPSISAAIFAVPLPICTKAYLQAVQTFDIFADIFGRGTLQEIGFVDVTEDMVKSIYRCFYYYWEEEVPVQQAHEDIGFAKEHCRAVKGTRSKDNRSWQEVLERGKHSKTEASSYKRDYSSHKPSESAAQGHQRDESIRPSQPSFAADRYKDYTYSVGRTVLRISCEPALVQMPDLIVVIGDLFRQLHNATGFNPENIPQNLRYPNKKNSFEFLSGINSQPLILKLFIGDSKQESINKAFIDLEEIVTNPGFNLTLIQSVVFTSSTLYSSDDRAGAYPKLDPKLVGAFTRNVYEFLKTCTTSAGTLSATISTGQAAFPVVQKVLDSRQEEAKKSGKGGDSSRKTKSSTEECGVCFDGKYEPHMLTCCHGAICKFCFEKVKSERCPFCRKPFTSMRGNQPEGKMDIRLDRTIRLKGHEKFGSYSIKYTFLSGRQQKDHPEPGKPYDMTVRNAYLPASEEGTRVLRLLRVAFLRRLTFTIGDSHTTGKKGVITWNDIHHKTSLKEGSAHGYPDPDYLSNVTRELADRGVTEASMSEDEKKDASRIYERIKRFDRFLDF